MTAHAWPQAMCGHQPSVVARAVQHAAIGVMDQARGWLPMSDSHAQGGRDKRFIVAIRQGPADDLARVQIDQHGEVKPADARTDEGHVAHPALIRTFGLEPPTHEIRRRVLVSTSVVRDLEAPASTRLDAMLAPHPGDAVAPASDPLGDERLPHLACAIGLSPTMASGTIYS